MISATNVFWGFNLVLPLVLVMELLRWIAGGYDHYRWYAAVVRGITRVWWTCMAFGVFIAYVLGGGVQQALTFTTQPEQSEVLVATPGVVLMIAGGIAVFLCLGVAEIGAWLTWAMAYRRLPWQLASDASEWVSDLAYRLANHATDYWLTRPDGERRTVWLAVGTIGTAATLALMYLTGTSYTTGAFWVGCFLVAYFVIGPSLNRIIGPSKVELRNREYSDDGD